MSKVRSSLLVLSLGAQGFAVGAPPLNLAGQNSAPAKRGRPISEDDLVYMDNLKSEESLLKDAGRIRFAIVGRSLPSRKGRDLHHFNAGDVVTVLKDSSDGRWVSVETINPIARRAKKKAWVPKNAVERSEPPKAEAPAEASSATGGGEQDFTATGADPKPAPESENP